MPIVPYVGSRPMMPVEMPMSSVVTMSVSRRPIRSPMLPKMIPPIGRTANPTPNVAKAARVPAPPSLSLKNSSSKTSAAAVP
jgi:hypothetical protein